MTQKTREALVAQLIHLGAMPGEAEILANQADNNLRPGATFPEAWEYIKKHCSI